MDHMGLLLISDLLQIVHRFDVLRPLHLCFNIVEVAVRLRPGCNTHSLQTVEPGFARDESLPLRRAWAGQSNNLTGCSVAAVEWSEQLVMESGAGFRFEPTDKVYLCGSREAPRRFIAHFQPEKA